MAVASRYYESDFSEVASHCISFSSGAHDVAFKKQLEYFQKMLSKKHLLIYFDVEIWKC